MKRFIISTIVLVMMLVSIGGCYIGWDESWGWGRRGGGHGGGHGRD